MGVMRFLVHPAETLSDWPEVHLAYLSAADQTVWPTRIEIEGNEVLCRRQNSDSGKLHVTWPVAGFGRPVICTSSLPERPTPYLLVLELARGKIVQVRNQLAFWEGAGMAIPNDFAELHRAAHHLFAQAASSQDDVATCSGLAQQALEKACAAAEMLTVSYTQQRLETRHRQYPQLPTALGCNLGDSLPGDDWSAKFLPAFNAAAVPVQWRFIEPEEGNYNWEAYDAQVEWCLANDLLLRGGPLIDLSPNGMPEWLKHWEQDYWNMESFVCDFVETAISRYLEKIRTWEISARVNTGGGLRLTEEQRLTLVAKTLEVGRQVDEKNQYLLRIDQPWGDYQARGQHKLSPMQFVDALHRAGLGLAGVNLEIAIGYAPRGTASRDLLDFSRMIDQWSTLGIPLQVTLAFPSAANDDSQSISGLEVLRDSWKLPWSEESQADWLGQHLTLLMAKPSVVSIFWSHFTDVQPHYFPHAGLLGVQGNPKPSLARLAHYRAAYWK